MEVNAESSKGENYLPRERAGLQEVPALFSEQETVLKPTNNYVSPVEVSDLEKTIQQQSGNKGTPVSVYTTEQLIYMVYQNGIIIQQQMQLLAHAVQTNNVNHLINETVRDSPYFARKCAVNTNKKHKSFSTALSCNQIQSDHFNCLLLHGMKPNVVAGRRYYYEDFLETFGRGPLEPPVQLEASRDSRPWANEGNDSYDSIVATLPRYHREQNRRAQLGLFYLYN